MEKATKYRRGCAWHIHALSAPRTVHGGEHSARREPVLAPSEMHWHDVDPTRHFQQA